MENIYTFIPSKVELFSGMVSSAYGIGVWCLGYDEKTVSLFDTTSKHKEILQTFMDISCVLDVVKRHEEQKPVFFCDALGCVWVGEWANMDMEGFGGLLFVLGPVMYGINPAQNLERQLKEMHYSQRIREPLIEVLQTLPVVEPTTFMSLGVMLHFILTGQEISMSDCIYQTKYTDRQMNETESGSALGKEESEQATEAILMRIVREGDVEGAKRNHGTKWLGRVMELDIADPLRMEKDTLIVFITLCSRAAMEGGLPPRTASEMVKQYISAIESTAMPTMLTDLSRTMFLDFTQRVRNIRSGPDLSKPILDCCAYVQSNLFQEIRLEEMAKEIGYSEYYLTKKFAKEMGMKLSDYIKNQRIAHAGILLQTTDKSVQEISNLLHFSSRNYFSAVFQSVMGVTPAAYRSGARKKENNNAAKKEN